MKIYLGADHRGFRLKSNVLEHLRSAGHEVVDKGDAEYDPDDDFPQFAGRVASGILSDDDHTAKGVLLCGSGQGMCMAANRFKGIRAALGYSITAAQDTRNDEDSNVLCIPAESLEERQVLQIIDAWLAADFSHAPRHKRRIQELDVL